MWEMPHSNFLCSFLINSFSHWGIISSLVKVQSPLCEERWVNGSGRREGTGGGRKEVHRDEGRDKNSKERYMRYEKEG